MKHLRRQVSHVAVEEDEQRLDDARVRGEAGREGRQDPVDGAHHDTAKRHHQKTHDTQKHIRHMDRSHTAVLLKEMIQHLQTRTTGSVHQKWTPSTALEPQGNSLTKHTDLVSQTGLSLGQD